MRKLAIFTILVIPVICKAQLSEDIALLKDKVISNADDHQRQETSVFKGVLKFYKSAISDQIINDCIYEESCSAFSHGAIEEFGLFKGIFLTGDRMMRCNRLSQLHVMPVRINKDGKISDHWLDYAKE